MDLDVKIREYQEKDLERVLELVRELESELAKKFKDIQIKSGIEDYRDRYLKMGNKYKTLVAVVDNKVVGYLMGYPSLGAPEVDNMYDILPVSPKWITPEFFLQITFVSKPYRNQGISTKLHKEIIEYARQQGHKEVYACIAKWNTPEIKVISSLKFKLKDLGYRYRLTLKL
ncbi:MAG: GNAT family N-acetyltransferase [Candidatus Aminicenantes bacterium]|nr:GNAT family N-acetyltransferase [Candidatus Aminicenantes bacterium]